MSSRVILYVPDSQGRLKPKNFDAVLTQGITSNLSITRYPVQYGAPITDHFYKEPETITLDVAVSDIGLLPKLVDDGSMEVITDSFEEGQGSRSETAMRLLQEWQTRGLMRVLTKFKQFTDLLLVGISVTVSQTNGSTLMARLKFQKIRIASVVEATAVEFENDEEDTLGGPYDEDGLVEGQTFGTSVAEVAVKTGAGVLVGGLAGAVVGGILGTFIFPGAGTVGGAILGAKIGAAIGGSLNFITSTFRKLFGG